MSRIVYKCCECSYKHYDTTKIANHLMRAHNYPTEDANISFDYISTAPASGVFKIEEHEIAGFSLSGWKASNGVIEISRTKRLLQTWPEEITIYGDTFTLADVVEGSYDRQGRIYQVAEYL